MSLQVSQPKLDSVLLPHHQNTSFLDPLQNYVFDFPPCQNLQYQHQCRRLCNPLDF